jgi:hypothetical protein
VVEAGESKPKIHATPARSATDESLLETEADDLTQAHWYKSSWSSYNGNCVEIAELGGRRIGVRDTKDAGSGPVLIFGETAWRSFLDGVKNGE